MSNETAMSIPYISLAIVQTLYKRACEKANDDLPRYLPRVEKFLKGQIAEGGLEHSFSRFKLLELGFLLERFQPRSILELGGGATTAVFAEYAAKSTFEVNYISIDESPNYQELTKEKIDSTIRKRVNFKVCEKQTVNKGEGTPNCHYATDYFNYFPQGIDFLYIDGPSNHYKDKEYMPCIDNMLLIKEGIVPKVIAYDLRIHSIKAFESEPEFLWYDTTRRHESLEQKDLLWFVEKPFHHTLQVLRTEGTRLWP